MYSNFQLVVESVPPRWPVTMGGNAYLKTPTLTFLRQSTQHLGETVLAIMDLLSLKVY